MFGRGRHQAQRGGVGGKGIHCCRRTQCKGAGKCSPLRLWKVADPARNRRQQLGQPREGQLCLRLRAARAEDGPVPTATGGVLEQRRLADARLAHHQKNAALAPLRGCHQTPDETQLF